MSEIVTDTTVSNIRVMGTLSMGNTIVADGINGLHIPYPVILQTDTNFEAPDENGKGFLYFNEADNNLNIKFKKSDGSIIIRQINTQDGD